MESTVACALGEELDDEPAQGETENLERLEGKRVLLVDDNELNREILKEILVGRGLSVEEAGNGRDAVADVQEKEAGYYHFILMDIEMPVMDGYEATMKFRKLPNRIRANIPIIALTANAVPENRERAAETRRKAPEKQGMMVKFPSVCTCMTDPCSRSLLHGWRKSSRILILHSFRALTPWIIIRICRPVERRCRILLLAGGSL